MAEAVSEDRSLRLRRGMRGGGLKKSIAFGLVAATAAAGAAVLRARFRLDLRGKVVLITGGSRGLGLALAREFAARGCHLILCARNWEELARAKHDLAAH